MNSLGFQVKRQKRKKPIRTVNDFIKKRKKQKEEKLAKVANLINEVETLKDQWTEIDTSKIAAFNDFPLSTKTKQGLKDNSYEIPTDIQKESIGFALQGEDILGAAQTGSGKTLAFLIPVLEILHSKNWGKTDGLGALIITPTRELAYQIYETLRKVGSYHDFSAGLIIGGKSLEFEKTRMDSCNIIICTPGRILHHMDMNPLFDADNLQILVLDEADRILDLGFRETMNNIVEFLPKERQTLLFSATQTKSVKDLARLSLKNPKYVSVHEYKSHSTPDGLTQSYVVCELHDKLKFLYSFLNNHKPFKTLIFFSTCKQVRFVCRLFHELHPDWNVLALYGGLHQLKRMAIYDAFSASDRGIMFATDLASRGLDFPNVDWVVQMDCPEDGNTYIHRAGRTARYKKGGESLLVLLPSEEEGMIRELEGKKIPINKIRVNPRKLRIPMDKIGTALAKNLDLKENAQRAFTSYVKNVYLMKNKRIFKSDGLNFEKFAHSLGLISVPRVRFLEKKDIFITKRSEPKTEPENDAENGKTKTINGKTKSEKNSPDDEDEDDILKLKRKNHELDEKLPDEKEIEDMKKNKVEQKKSRLTKAAMAKKLLSKNIQINKHTYYREDVEQPIVTSNINDKVTKEARDYENEEDEGGIDIKRAREILRLEDKYDYRLFRETVKEKHRMLKKKDEEEKKKNKNKKEDEDEDQSQDEFGTDDEDYEPDVSWLPNPDEVYNEDDEDDEDEDEDDGDDSDNDDNEESSDDD